MPIRAKDQFALTPPMGWNSWDCYMSAVNEEQLLGNAAYMAEHLKAFGWEYVVCDIQWSEPNAGTCLGVEYIPLAPLCMDEYGRLIPAENRFPSSAGGKGFRPIADKVHAMGLKFGIHIMRGIPRQAAHARLPIKGTDTTADRIADPTSICPWNSDMYGVKGDLAASQAYYDSLFELYAAWGVDFVKVDDCGACGPQGVTRRAAVREIEMIRSAIDKTGRAIVFSLSPGPAHIAESHLLGKNANMWRMTDDFWDNWPALKAMFERCEVWERHVRPGCWPDCDMLPLGHIGIAYGKGRQTNFTPDEQKTMLTLWCIFRSPLMLGGELRDTDDATLKLITNAEVLRANQTGSEPWQITRDAASAVWASKAADGGVYLALFNLSEEARTVTASLEETGVTCAAVRDLWAGKALPDADGAVAAEIPAHGAVLYHLSAK